MTSVARNTTSATLSPRCWTSCRVSTTFERSTSIASCAPAALPDSPARLGLSTAAAAVACRDWVDRGLRVPEARAAWLWSRGRRGPSGLVLVDSPRRARLALDRRLRRRGPHGLALGEARCRQAGG